MCNASKTIKKVIGIKKIKIALISTIVFMTVFFLTVILDIHVPLFFKDSSVRGDDKPLTSEATSLAEITPQAKIQSFSVNISPFPSTAPLSPAGFDADASSEDTSAVLSPVPDSTAAEVNADAAAAQSPQSAEITPTAAPEKDPAKTEEKSEPKPEAKYADIGISIAKEYVNIREKASTDSSILGKLYKGSAATILKTKGDWYYVESGSVKGYVNAEFLKTGIPDDEITEKYGTLSVSVAVDGLNVRIEPSTEAKKVTVIYMNEIYPVLKDKGDWLQIKITDENKTGYVKKEFAKLLVEFKEAVSREEEEKLAQLAAEEKARKETQIQYSGGVSYSSVDLELLTCLIHAEAGTQSYEGKLAVANIVLNRVKSSKYAGSIKAVIYQPGQFSVASSGSLKKQLNNYSNYSSSSQRMSKKAAKDALEGANNIGKRLYFHSYGAAVKKGYDDKSTSVKIGGLLFW